MSTEEVFIPSASGRAGQECIFSGDSIIPQHPARFCSPTDRFVVCINTGTVKGSGERAWEPLSYGLEGQPSPEMLLRRGFRASSFDSEEEANKALRDSWGRWTNDNLKFHLNRMFSILKVEVSHVPA